MFSLIVPIYKNESNVERLLPELAALNGQLGGRLEAVFVVDASPDRSYELLRAQLPGAPFRSQLLVLSRNFGSFPAIMAGMEAATGEFFAVLAADLQEPPDLVQTFFTLLAEDQADVVFGYRQKRAEPFFSRIASQAFWSVYRRFVVKDMPRGGVDVFGCNRLMRDRVLEFRESHTNLIALLFWIGYRRMYVGYNRTARTSGKSAWTFNKKIRYCLDSIFNFTDLPIQLLLYSGALALVLAVAGSMVLLFAKWHGDIHVPGYTPTVLAILFFGALTSLGFGILGQYLWLTLQNARRRPNYIVHTAETFDRARASNGS